MCTKLITVCFLHNQLIRIHSTRRIFPVIYIHSNVPAVSAGFINTEKDKMNEIIKHFCSTVRRDCQREIMYAKTVEMAFSEQCP